MGCSFGSDHAEGAFVHLENHDVSYVAVSRAPWPEIEPFKKRMGWHMDWVSAAGDSFNQDFGVSHAKDDKAPNGNNYNFGTARFTGPGTVAVTHGDQDREVTADNIVIATGTRPARPEGGGNAALTLIPIIELCHYCPGIVTALGVSTGLAAGTSTTRPRS